MAWCIPNTTRLGPTLAGTVVIADGIRTFRLLPGLPSKLDLLGEDEWMDPGADPEKNCGGVHRLGSREHIISYQLYSSITISSLTII